ncbi:het domain protein [Fusarium tjaetaba]|uniref:Het domain protein n=1 Tax=Fusarium tjaetaba TaxID=1567544 RepID=A0A8H5RSE2_9HYPO|nr:het domain protein [Fusarium tjaetaba]KAF5638772.1 het domain protein [Fusarium tjaetaba]
MESRQDAQATETTPLLTPTINRDYCSTDELSRSSPNFPQSREEAKKHIEEICQTHHDLLCEEQYSSLNRFLFELLQNADDNAYGDQTPHVALRYDGRYLSIESNELGFSKKNVVSICKFSQSTKASKSTGPSDRNFIGEKGIGFKSVFMIATKVWIKSGHYSFSLDQSRLLGEISPHWAEHFPVAANLPSGTLIVLELSENFLGAEKATELVMTLQRFSAVELLFLSQVKHIDIELIRATSWISSIMSKDRTWKTTLTADLIPHELKVLNVAKTWEADRMNAYVTYRHIVNYMLPDSRRPGRHSAEIILAFPDRLNEDNPIATKKVYAFLPVRDYGFKFLVHSDFIVSTNREDIQPCEWNKRLAMEICNALSEAIPKFKTQYPELWFKWPLLLPDRNDGNGIFQRTGELSLEVLSRQPVFQDVDGHVRTPGEVFSIPQHFRDETGYPLIPSEVSGHRIISGMYPIQTSSYLQRLGVRVLTNRQFLNDLKTYIKRFPYVFQEKTNSWHVRLCIALLKLVKEYKKEIQSLPIIPLHGLDQWVSASSGSLYFAIDGLSSPLLGSLGDCWAVDPSYYGTARGHLFIQLGVKQGSTTQLCKSIIDENSKSIHRTSTTLDDLMKQILFLYEANWKPSTTISHGFWFITCDMGRAQASELYIESDTPLMASDIHIKTALKLQFIHPRYIESLRDFSGGIEWLMKCFGLQSQLRIIDHQRAPHEDFQRLLKEAPRITLEVLKLHWDFYCPLFQNNNRPEMSPEETLTYNSIVPADRLLDVPSADDGDWDFLTVFGVTTQPNASLFINLLREVRGQQVPHTYVREIYLQLEKYRATSDKYLVDWLFHEQRCIYIPHHYNGQTGDWYDTEACVWQGPACLRQTPQLVLFYAELHGLFEDLTPTTTFDTMKKEVDHLDTKDIAHIFAVLQSISDFLVQSRDEPNTKIPDVKSWRMFPVRLADTGEVVLRSWGKPWDESWLIPDETHLWQVFKDVVDLCRFSLKDLQSLSGLTHKMTFSLRRISWHATKKVLGPEDDICRPLEPYAQNLRDKARYISQLIPQQTKTGRVAKLRKLLRNIKVFQSGRIETVWTLRFQDKKHESVSSENQAMVQIQDNVLKAYVVCEDKFLVHDYTPPDLVRALAEFLHIQDPDDLSLLATILERTNHSFIERDLDHRAQRRMLSYSSIGLVQSDDLSSVASDELVMPGSTDNAGPSSSHNVREFPFEPHQTASPSTIRAKKSEEGRAKQLDGEPALKPQAGTEPGSDKAAGESGLVSGGIKSKKVDFSKANGNGSSPSLGSILVKEEGKDEADEPHQSPYDKHPGMLPDRHVKEDQANTERGKSASPRPRADENSISARAETPSGDAVERGRDRQRPEAVAEFSTHQQPPPKKLTDHSSGDTKTLHLTDKNDNLPLPGKSIRSRSVGDTAGAHSSPWTVSLPTDYSKIQEARREEEDRRAAESKLTSDELDDYLSMSKGRFQPSTSSTTFEGYDTQETIYRGELCISKSCTFHIQVCATNLGLHSHFQLSSAQYEKARKMKLHPGRKTRNVYILARVYDLGTDPNYALYIDPWHLYEDNRLLLHPPSHFTAKVTLEANAVLAGSYRAASGVAEGKSNSIYRGLELKDQQIRLLRLNLDEDQPLKVTLVRKDLQQAPVFWAISYVWGLPPTTLGPFLDVNGVQVPITDSLSSCLTCLRKQQADALIWVDAICINQNDDTEKAVQVSQMGKVYQTAEQVIIWMGPEQPDEKGVLTTISKLQQSTSKTKSEYQLRLDDVRLIRSLLQRQWFIRTWIIQELVFASKPFLMHGSSRIEWNIFIEGVLECEARVQNTPGLAYQEGLFHRPAMALHTIRQNYQGSRSGASPKRHKYSFLELVEMFFYTRSSEARDKIFALLNLAHDMEDEAFRPDYGSEESVILSRCALHLVKSQHTLDLIYHAGFGKGASFCRWIPDLMNSAKREVYAPTISTWESAGTRGHPGFNAGAPLSILATAEDLGGRGETPVPVLNISGRFFDTIQNCRASGVNSTITGIPFCQVIHDFRRFISHLDNYHDLGKSWEIGLIIKCLTGDAARPQTSSSSLSAFTTHERSSPGIWPPDLAKYVGEIDPGRDGYEYARQRREYEKVHDLFWETVSAFLGRFPGTNICVTEKGYAGIVPSSAKRGDKIFVPHSSKVPFVVRKSAMRNIKPDHYQLVGEAYIQGIMYYDQSPLREMSGQKDEQICLI